MYIFRISIGAKRRMHQCACEGRVLTSIIMAAKTNMRQNYLTFAECRPIYVMPLCQNSPVMWLVRLLEFENIFFNFAYFLFSHSLILRVRVPIQTLSTAIAYRLR